MNKTNRRDLLRIGSASLAFPLLSVLDIDCSASENGTKSNTESVPENAPDKYKKATDIGAVMKVQYLEIVSPDVDAICKTYEQVHGLKFGKADVNLGNARTAKLPNGGFVAVRAPLRDTEEPIRRRYRSCSLEGSGIRRKDCTSPNATSRTRNLCDLHPRRGRTRALATRELAKLKRWLGLVK